MDITEQKQAEQALHESKERYRNLFDLVPVAVYACDADGMIQEFNHRAVELWGREPEKNNPKEKFCGSFKIYYPDGRFMPHAACPMARMLGGETLEPHELEILVERPDGLRRNVLAHPLALKNERGEIIGAINCLYDITERKQAEEKIIFQANLLGAVGSAVIATDLNGIVLYWNPAAEKLYGWSSSDALGRNIVEVALCTSIAGTGGGNHEISLRAGNHGAGISSYNGGMEVRSRPSCPIRRSWIPMENWWALLASQAISPISNRLKRHCVHQMNGSVPLSGRPLQELFVKMLTAGCYLSIRLFARCWGTRKQN